MESFDVIVFDIVGTLVDEVGTVIDAVRSTLGAQGVPDDVAGDVAAEWLDRFHRTTREMAGGGQAYQDDPSLRRALLGDLLAERRIKLEPGPFDDLACVGYRLTAWPGTPESTLFVAAHPWDLRGAAGQGLRTGYLPRPHADEPAADDRFDVTLTGLDELVGLVAAS